MATPIPWLCCPQAILSQLWKYAWGHCPFGRTICDQALTLTDVLRCCFNISTYFSILMMPFILWSAPVPPAAKHPHNMNRASRLGWCSLPCKPPTFSSKHNDGHYGQTVLFLFHQTRGHFSKKYDLCPHVQLQTVVWIFHGGFGAVASSLLRGHSGYVAIGLVLLWI